MSEQQYQDELSAARIAVRLCRAEHADTIERLTAAIDRTEAWAALWKICAKVNRQRYREQQQANSADKRILGQIAMLVLDLEENQSTKSVARKLRSILGMAPKAPSCRPCIDSGLVCSQWDELDFDYCECVAGKQRRKKDWG